MDQFWIYLIIIAIWVIKAIADARQQQKKPLPGKKTPLPPLPQKIEHVLHEVNSSASEVKIPARKTRKPVTAQVKEAPAPLKKNNLFGARTAAEAFILSEIFSKPKSERLRKRL